MVYIALWWLIIEIIGTAALPMTYRIFHWLPDRGYVFTKTLGLLLVSYILWMGAITGFLQNNLGGIIFAVLVVIGMAIWLLLKPVKSSGAIDRPGKKNTASGIQFLLQYVSQNKRQIIVVEVLFALTFIAWAALRAAAPDKIMNAGGEKFMEMAFLNGVLNSPTFPPIDVWLSGFGISYYYFGYVMMGLLTRLSGAPAGVGFELYDALLFAMAIIGAYGVVYNLVAASLKKRARQEQGRPSQPILYGLLGSLIVIIMGNLQGVLESLYSLEILPERFWLWIDIPGLASTPASGSLFPGGGFFGCCWRASRILQDYDLLGNPVGASPITEFPIFSFLLGDNHPHVLALPFVFLNIALAFNLLLRQAKHRPNIVSSSAPEHKNRVEWWNPISSLSSGRPYQDFLLFLGYAFCLGSLGFLNTWDMPIYLGLIALAYLLGEYWHEKKLAGDIIRRTIILSAGLLITAVMFYLMFYLGFSSQAGGVLPYLNPPTRLPQFLVMFGVFIFITTWFLIVSSFASRKKQPPLVYLIQRWLKAWLIVLLIGVGITAFFIVLVFLIEPIRTTTGLGQNLPSITALLAGLAPSQALPKIAQARLNNPWLFLLLSGLISLAVINIFPVEKFSLAAAFTDDETHTKTQSSAISDSGNEPQRYEYADRSNIFTSLMIFVGLALALSVELFFLADSFGARMNTVFKFYYQTWVLLGLSSAYGVWWVLNTTLPSRSSRSANKIARVLFALTTTLLIGAGLIYSVGGTYQRAGGFQAPLNLDGTSNLAKANPDDWAAITWLKQALPHTTDAPTILEAPGKSYNYEGRISAFSGYPALLGWALHEAQWRGNYDEQGLREPDIQTIYTTRDAQLALELLRKWDVHYVIVGNTEKNYILQLCSDTQRACNLSRALEKFDMILTPVFQQGDMTIYQVPNTGN